MSSLYLLLECEATDCIWHLGVIRVVTMCRTAKPDGLYDRLTRLLSSFWSFCPLLVISGQAAFVLLCLGIFTGQEAGLVVSSFSLLIRTGELVLGILDSEGREWRVEKREQS